MVYILISMGRRRMELLSPRMHPVWTCACDKRVINTELFKPDEIGAMHFTARYRRRMNMFNILNGVCRTFDIDMNFHVFVLVKLNNIFVSVNINSSEIWQ